jgi:hypothetical protein
LNRFIEYQKKLLQINENNFDDIAFDLLLFQASHNPVYQRYLEYLEFDLKNIQSLEQTPFLPIQFFKNHSIKTGEWPTQKIYQSSGTTGSVRSSHHLWDESFYLHHAATTFERFFGPLRGFHILALLPSYDTAHSSLVAMTKYFIGRSASPYSGFYLNDHGRLLATIRALDQSDRKVLLLGVSHALLDLSSSGNFSFKNLLVMETGGMKGFKKELTRYELHEKIKTALGVTTVFSEYGMTELCSQAYALAEGIFQCPPTMRVIIKEINDPFCEAKSTGIINVIDLANVHSCCFIETQDLGKVTGSGFEVLGRADNSEARGCNLLITGQL